MTEQKPSKKSSGTNINTDGGTYIGGNVNTSGGDFIGRDKIISDHNEMKLSFTHIYAAIEQHSDLSAQEKDDLKAETKDIEVELKKGEKVNVSFLERRLRNIKRMAPDMLEVILATMADPATGFGRVAKKIADKMKSSAQ